MNRRHKGFTLIELLVVMSIIALLLSILVPALGRARAQAMLAKDASQVNGIFKGWTSWAGEREGWFPVPGLEKRQADPVLGFVKGRGPEDVLMNDHGSMLSMCIMQNLFTPDVLVAPTEPNGSVFVKEDYDFNTYDIAGWVFWDEEFSNQLDPDGGAEGNNSYGIAPITGERKIEHWGWHEINDSAYAVVGTRGPENGAVDQSSFSTRFHGVDGEWKGIICYGDNHTETMDTFYPQNATYMNSSGASTPDNIFDDETFARNTLNGTGIGTGYDIVLTHVAAGDINDDGNHGGVDEYQHD